MSYTLLLEEWWGNHWMRVSTVMQAGYDEVALLVDDLMADLPNENNE